MSRGSLIVGSNVVGRPVTGLPVGLPPAGAGGFDPATIFDQYPSVYGDYFRADLSPIQESSGAFVRWPGLRDDAIADAGACFDLVPWIGTNNVTATGPHGENVLLHQYMSASQGRGGSQSINIPSPMNAGYEHEGRTYGVLVKFGATTVARLTETDNFEGTLFLGANSTTEQGFARYYDDSGSYNQYSVTATPSLVGQWVAYVVRRDTNNSGKYTLFRSDNLLASIGDSPANVSDRVTNKWYSTGDNTNAEFAGWFRQHRAMSDAECLAMLNWLIAGAV